MFDKIVLSPRQETRVTENRHVHEHRAPTDKSVELLKEMEEAARKKVVAGLMIADNKFSCVTQLEMDHEQGVMRARCIFELNGYRMTVEESEPAEDSPAYVSQLIVKLRAAIAEKIVEHIVQHLRLPKW